MPIFDLPVWRVFGTAQRINSPEGAGGSSFEAFKAVNKLFIPGLVKNPVIFEEWGYAW
jgi:hypothetical protein